ncbi:hypothetical protein L1887_16790 [Cichorium endivia]|nr:hypothetical protein L1887_16790 [Cichorium endivia]
MYRLQSPRSKRRDGSSFKEDNKPLAQEPLYTPAAIRHRRRLQSAKYISLPLISHRRRLQSAIAACCNPPSPPAAIRHRRLLQSAIVRCNPPSPSLSIYISHESRRTLIGLSCTIAPPLGTIRF